MFKNFSIKNKILSISIFSILAFVIYLVYSGFSINTNKDTLTHVKEQSYPILEKANANLFFFGQMNSIIEGAVISADIDALDTAKDIQNNILENVKYINSIDDSLNNYFTVKELTDFFALSNNLTKDIIDNGFTESVGSKISQKNESSEKLLNSLQSYKNDSLQYFNQTIDETIIRSETNITIGLLIGAVTLVVLSLISFAIIKTISTSLQNVINSFKELSEGDGDLTQRLHYDKKDEIADLVGYFNKLMEKLNTGFKEIHGNYLRLQENNEQISSVINETNSLTVQQNNFTNEVDKVVIQTTNEINEVNDITSETINLFKNTLKESDSALDLVSNNKQSIEKLSNELEHSNDLVKQLEEGSNNINEILNVIKGIAEQTNLLALNAAIEAARAGDAGRGFAVVADEVRKLASQTQDSTNNIQEVIEKLQTISQSVVNTVHNSHSMAIESVGYSDSVNVAINHINDYIKQVYSFNENIANLNGQQLSNSGLIKKNVSDIKELSGESVNLSSQLKNSFEDLNEVSENLGGVISQFKF